MSYPPLPPMEGFVLNPSNSRGPNHHAIPFHRALADYLVLWEDCRRRECRLAGACRGRQAACYDERRPEIIAIMTTLLHDGYITEDGELL